MRYLEHIGISLLILTLCHLCFVVSDADDCLKDKEVGPCTNYTTRWYYDQAEKGCRQFWFGGCNPGVNNFETQEKCKETCSHLFSGKFILFLL